jgi:tRNA-modifying protein YgfZ
MHRTTQFLAQHTALTRHVGWAQLPGRTIIAVTGADRIQFLQSFTTNDIKKLAIGTGCEAFVTSPQGKTLGHVFVFCDANQHIVGTTPGQAAALLAHFERYVISEDVLFTDRSADFRPLLVSGPQAAALLQRVGGIQPPDDLFAHVQATIAGRSLAVRRVVYTGDSSFFVQAKAIDAQQVMAALSEAGALACEEPAVEAVRLEAGFPLFGIDITPDNLPQEVNRDQQAISFTKGCYLGQETVARIDAIGHVNRLLVGLKFAASEAPPPGTALLAGDQPVGHVTSAAWSPRLAAPLALGYVRRNHTKTGTQLSSSAGLAEVIGLPLA